MADAYPKICFAFNDNGDTVRVFGACDRVELTAGIKPNAFELIVPKHEFDKFDGDYRRHGILEMYWSDPDSPDVRLGVWDFDAKPIGGWSVEMVEDTLSGKGPGEAAAEVKEKTLTLLDRRWEFIDGLGGHAFAGLVNAKAADGKTVTNPPGTPFAADGATYYSLLFWLAGQLQHATGLPRLDRDFYPPHVAPLTIEKPADLKWDGVNIPNQIARLLDEVEAVWTLSAAGTYGIHLLGTGDAPALPNALPSESHELRMTRPQIVIVTSAPRPAYNQIAIQGVASTGDPVLEYVGMDTDGTVKPVAELSYVVPHTMERAVEIVRTRYAGLEGAALGMAVNSLFTMLRIRSVTPETYLPFIARLVDTIEDVPGSARLRPDGPVRIEARVALQDPRGVWKNSVLPLRINPSVVLPREGLFLFDGPLGKVSPNGVIGRMSHFEPLGSGDLLLTAATMTDFGDHRDYFTIGYRLVAGVVTELTPEELTDALGPDSGECTVLSIPELAEHRVAGVGQNTAVLKAAAKARASRILTNQEAVERKRHLGFHSVSPNGNIASVCWNMREGTTEYDWKPYFFGKHRYLDKRRLAEIVRGADAGNRISKAAPVAVTEGERDYAPRFWGMGGVDTTGDMGGVGDLYGKVTANWTNVAGNGSYVDCNPCKDKSGTDPDTGVTVRVYLFRCGQNGDPNVREGDVIAYRLGIDGEAICTSGHMDAPIGAVATTRIVTDPRIGRGWQIYAGMGGRVPAGYVSGGDGDSEYGTALGTYGAKTHDHDDHPDHKHLVDSFTPKISAPTDGDLTLPYPWTGGSVKDDGSPPTGDASDWSHSAEDHRDPQRVLVFIERVD